MENQVDVRRAPEEPERCALVAKSSKLPCDALALAGCQFYCPPEAQTVHWPGFRRPTSPTYHFLNLFHA